ncbi:hypothetical protein PAPYR_8187 [Paratrimastix pyriformis]|uniref:Uncharacterized protein n=1 Tax=Paratrimastix pyriformis TaxID=342808 RepID=A0ABQ8UEK3_9EUKA|nr:hypothetical protein PAPYR_8187 [Paratrimastix pyriformis]
MSIDLNSSHQDDVSIIDQMGRTHFSSSFCSDETSSSSSSDAGAQSTQLLLDPCPVSTFATSPPPPFSPSLCAFADHRMRNETGSAPSTPPSLHPRLHHAAVSPPHPAQSPRHPQLSSSAASLPMPVPRPPTGRPTITDGGGGGSAPIVVLSASPRGRVVVGGVAASTAHLMGSPPSPFGSPSGSSGAGRSRPLFSPGSSPLARSPPPGFESRPTQGHFPMSPPGFESRLGQIHFPAGPTASASCVTMGFLRPRVQ